MFDIVDRIKPTVDLGKHFDESNSYMKFGTKWVKNKLEYPQVQTDMVAILVILHRRKPIFKFEQEFEKSNSYLKLEAMRVS